MSDEKIHSVPESEDEKKEALKFDRKALEIINNSRNLKVDEEAWKKFDKPVPPSDPYNYSIQVLGDLHGKIVLEVGCGTGWLSIILAKRGAEVYGFEISPVSVAIAKKAAEINGVSGKIHFKTMTAYSLDYEKNFFDLVYGLNILHHMDIKSATKEIWRVLKPGGRAVFSEPIANSRVLQTIRSYLPIPIDDDSEYPKPPLTYEQLSRFNEIFTDSKFIEFQLFMRLERIIRNQYILHVIAQIDHFLLKYIPPLRRFGRYLVIVAKKEGPPK